VTSVTDDPALAITSLFSYAGSLIHQVSVDVSEEYNWQFSAPKNVDVRPRLSFE